MQKCPTSAATRTTSGSIVKNLFSKRFETMSGNGAAVLEKKRDLQPWVSDRFHAYFIFVLFSPQVKFFAQFFSTSKPNFSTWQNFSPQAPPVVPVTNMKYGFTH